MSTVRRVYVEKKKEFAVNANALRHEIKHQLEVTGVKNVRLLVRYDVENVSDAVFDRAIQTVFSEPPVDDVYLEDFSYEGKVFSVEYLPGQFDQRADSAEQCIKLLNENESPVIRCATTYVIEGDVSDSELETIKKYCINPVDSRESSSEKPKTLSDVFEEPADVKILTGYIDMKEKEFKELYDSLSLAITFKDFLHIQNYFMNE